MPGPSSAQWYPAWLDQVLTEGTQRGWLKFVGTVGNHEVSSREVMMMTRLMRVEEK